MVLDKMVWHGSLGGKVAIFVVWFGFGGLDDSNWKKAWRGLGWAIGCCDAGDFAVSVHVQ